MSGNKRMRLARVQSSTQVSGGRLWSKGHLQTPLEQFKVTVAHDRVVTGARTCVLVGDQLRI